MSNEQKKSKLTFKGLMRPDFHCLSVVVLTGFHCTHKAEEAFCVVCHILKTIYNVITL